MPHEFDAIVIGAGQAGPSLAERLAASGQRVLLAEREHLGGTCVNNGCTPTKSLVATARVAHMARRAADFGVSVGSVSVDMKMVKARKDRIVGASVESLNNWLTGLENLTLVRAAAKFTSPHEVEVDGQRYTAPRIFINTGGRPIVPDWPGLAGVPYLTNESMMDLDVLPEHLVIVGGGYVGLEFAQIYRRFGSRVTVLERGPRLLKHEDEDVAEAVAGILRSEGITLQFNLDPGKFAIARLPSGDIGVALRGADQRDQVLGSHLLIATGRRPNIEGLDLGKAGVALDNKGYIAVDDQLRTNVDGIWALGDVNGRGAFTHSSYNDFEIVAAGILDNDPRSVSDRTAAYAIFIDPPLGRVGMTEAEVRASGRKALIGTRSMRRVGRARERSETDGFMKVLVDAETRRVLGASVLGIEGDEAIHVFIDNMAAKLPYTAISRSMHIHPTVSELIPTLLQDLRPLT